MSLQHPVIRVGSRTPHTSTARRCPCINLRISTFEVVLILTNSVLKFLFARLLKMNVLHYPPNAKKIPRY